jgi:BirA family biotin operon repressor/biotin-[acetyl-CoA-carboxylase] ligase
MGSQVLNYTELNSTNSEAEQLILNGEITSQALIVADYQTNGRGTGKNIWQSEAGKNLLFSWIIFPAFLSVNMHFQLSKAVSLAITDFLMDHSIAAQIKWPNDILYEDKKIAGILIENSLVGTTFKHSIIGIGLNVNQKEFPLFPIPAISMSTITSLSYKLMELLNGLNLSLGNRYEQLKTGDSGQIDLAYLDRMYRLNKESGFISGNKEFRGMIHGVNEMGELIVETKSGLSTFGFHDIKLIY